MSYHPGTLLHIAAIIPQQRHLLQLNQNQPICYPHDRNESIVTSSSSSTESKAESDGAKGNDESLKVTGFTHIPLWRSKILRWNNMENCHQIGSRLLWTEVICRGCSIRCSIQASLAMMLPITSVLLQSICHSWEHPASAPTSTKCLNHMYHVQESSAKFLYTHLRPNSLIMSSSTKGKRHQSYHPDKDGNRIDVFGRRVYSTSALAIKGWNCLACMTQFIDGKLDEFSGVLPLLPDEARCRALPIQLDGLVAAKQQISPAKHILESSARTLSLAVAIHRFAWLRSTNLPQDTWTLVEDMAFDESGLFSSETNATLRTLDKDIKASLSLGIGKPRLQTTIPAVAQAIPLARQIWET